MQLERWDASPSGGCGHAEASRLLEAHADGNPVTGPGRQTLLPEVLEREHANVAQLLLQARADTDQVNDQFATPVHVACELGRLDVVHMLLEALADVNWVDNRGSNPLPSGHSKRSSRHCAPLALEMTCVALRRELERREGPKKRVDVRTGAFRIEHSRRPSALAVQVRVSFRAPRPWRSASAFCHVSTRLDINGDGVLSFSEFSAGVLPGLPDPSGL